MCPDGGPAPSPPAWGTCEPSRPPHPMIAGPKWVQEINSPSLHPLWPPHWVLVHFPLSCGLPLPSDHPASGPAGQLVVVGEDPRRGGPTFRRVPLAPVESARSLPARSTRLTLLTCEDTSVTRRSRNAQWGLPPGCSLQGPLSRVIFLAMLGLNCGMWDLVPQPGIKPRPPALGAWSLSHWTTREVQTFNFVAAVDVPWSSFIMVGVNGILISVSLQFSSNLEKF